MAKNKRWEILFEDEYFIIVNKPAHLLTIPDRYNEDIENLYTSLTQYRDEIYINHRLDKETSGVILFSKSEEAHKRMSTLFESRDVDKLYYTIVHNTPFEDVGLIEMNLSMSRNNRKRMVISEKGKVAQTKYRVVSSWDYYALLEVKLITGRMHQIRTHMQAIHCPILCDPMYGDGEAFYLSQIKKKYRSSKGREEKPLLERVALHAHQLEFVHPFTQEKIHVNAEMPKDMRAVTKQLDKVFGQS